MAQIQVNNVTFGYEGSIDNIFEKISFVIDTDWKLGFIGRNGKGKTTFLNLLLGKYEYQGKISTQAVFDYFPYRIRDDWMGLSCAEFLEELQPDCELWRVICELEELKAPSEILYRAFGTLSHGERTKVMLAILFSRENYFLLIDEPTNHLDMHSRECVKEYLRGKKGFILVSHDRDLLDDCIDHVLVLNRETIEVQKGNFSSWWENKEKADSFHRAENEKHLREIGKLRQASERVNAWADKNERTKIGFDPIKEHDRCLSTRAYIGAKTKKMQSRVTQMEKRIDREIAEKEGLLKDIENPVDLKLMPLEHHKELLVHAREYGLGYGTYEVLRDFNFELRQGERVFLKGENGCGKSSFIKAILAQNGLKSSNGRSEIDTVQEEFLESFRSNARESGLLETASGLVISYIHQDTSHLCGRLEQFCTERGLDESLFKAILRQLDFERVQFTKRMEEYSEGQKKKVLIAAGLLKQAHLYIWDEPLNYVDVFSRMQIENLILRYQPTMLVVDHDIRFQEKISTRVVEMKRL
uniref:ATP-binding cassette domain-containing protein n=1 Tax=Acetatifactor sp. TaxID=1872090 RepID=UPI004055F66E